MPDPTASSATQRELEAIQTRYETLRDRLRFRENLWSYGRLLAFLVAAAGWIPIRSAAGTVLLVVIGGLLAFIWSIGRHRRARAAREQADRVVEVAAESLRRVGGRVVLIRDHRRPAPPTEDLELQPLPADGARWELTGQERDDFDFYAAPVGLFGLLNRTSTTPGARRLSDLLEHPLLSIEVIERRQAAVRWLAGERERRLRMLGAAAAFRSRGEWLEKLVRGVRRAELLPQRRRVVALRLWSLVSLAVVSAGLLIAAGGVWGLGYAVVGALVVNGRVYWQWRQRLQGTVGPWQDTVELIRTWRQAAREMVLALDGAPPDELQPIRTACLVLEDEHLLPALQRRVGWADTGGFFHSILNLVFLYDLHVADAITKVVVPHREALLRGWSAMAEAEALLSLACFADESSGTDEAPVTWPRLEPGTSIAIRDGRHPLVEPQTAVANDVVLNAGAKLWLVTGSNMAGKSTLLRMVGINSILAQLGTAVTAESMSLCPLRLITDLQARDNLSDVESYFLAEVRHLRRLVRPAAGEGVVLGLIDEPFRGTNSTEQVAASLAVAEHLLRSEGLYIIATHEWKLTELADRHDAAENVHFRENLGTNGMVFDYHLRPGPATTRNALRVLEQEGYPDTLLERARSIAQRQERQQH